MRSYLGSTSPLLGATPHPGYLRPRFSLTPYNGVLPNFWAEMTSLSGKRHQEISFRSDGYVSRYVFGSALGGPPVLKPFQICTKGVIFRDMSEMNVCLRVAMGEQPSRPQPNECDGVPMSDQLWNLAQDCWKSETEARPTAAEVLKRLQV
jgi:hypothetical protein